MVSNPVQAEHVAKLLYMIVVSSGYENLPEDLNFIFHFEDAFYLASDHTYGNPESVLQEFIQELKVFK